MIQLWQRSLLFMYIPFPMVILFGVEEFNCSQGLHNSIHRDLQAFKFSPTAVSRLQSQGAWLSSPGRPHHHPRTLPEMATSKSTARFINHTSHWNPPTPSPSSATHQPTTGVNSQMEAPSSFQQDMDTPMEEDSQEDRDTRNALLDQLREMAPANDSQPPSAQPGSQQNSTGADGTPSKTPRKRADYTREQKLAAIQYAQTTYQTRSDGSSQLISGPEAAKNLNMTWDVLRQWIKDVARIESMAPGSHRLRLKGKNTTQHNGVTKSKWKQPLTMFGRTPSEHRTVASYISDSNGQYPVAPQGTPSYDNPQSLVHYETIPSFYRSGLQTVQTINSNIDDSSSSTNSNVKFSNLKSSLIENATSNTSTLECSHVREYTLVNQSTIKGSSIFGESDIRFSNIENSSVSKSAVLHAIVKNCKIENSHVEGGEHIGKVYINSRIMPQVPKPPAVTRASGTGTGASADSPEMID
ncbi:hypothetical protein K402DRAFT_178732 [Aulographum hederae CBS 113979]|uniref:Uncharacterized protein n=1 Tax=Aulographum hederae CBS 113979 TaxID=1176131 RepID=A0A6G1GQV5_9PEZI|nr:hypothetical protein K402DRAFT_178732 [Aulographum hederae CBS 113979]